VSTPDLEMQLSWQKIKDGLALFTTLRLGIAAVGVLIVSIVPSSFKQIPVMVVIATVSRVPVPERVVMNLSIVVKCMASKDRQCGYRLWKILWPGTDVPAIRMPSSLVEGILGPTARGFDLQGRTTYEIEMLRSLSGTDTIVIEVQINGRVDQSDLRLIDIEGKNLIDESFDCRWSEIRPPVVVQVICEEDVRLMDRVIMMLPLIGG